MAPTLLKTGEAYIFVDGAYFERAFSAELERFVQKHFEVSFPRLMDNYNARRLFYYDCVDRTRRGDESDDQLAARVASKEERLRALQSLPGVHVRKGVLTGSKKKRRQKEVDVRLAVDMLEHANLRNYQKAVLISGDRDFRPVVNAVVRTGAWVSVIGQKQSLSIDLARAADSREYITFEWAIRQCSQEFEQENPLPYLSSDRNRDTPPEGSVEVTPVHAGLTVLRSPKDEYWSPVSKMKAWAHGRNQSQVEMYAILKNSS